MSDFKSIELGGPTDPNGQLDKAEPVNGWPYLIERRRVNLAEEFPDLIMEFPVGVLSPELLMGIAKRKGKA